MQSQHPAPEYSTLALVGPHGPTFPPGPPGPAAKLPPRRPQASQTGQVTPIRYRGRPGRAAGGASECVGTAVFWCNEVDRSLYRLGLGEAAGGPLRHRGEDVGSLRHATQKSGRAL